MRAVKSILIGVFTVMTLAGCGSPTMTESEAAASPGLAGQAVAPGKARIYVLRISSGLSMAAAKVRDGDRTIGSLRQNTYLCWEREPGETVIRSSWVPLLTPIERSEDVYELPLMVEAGNTYYLMQQWRMGKPPTRLAVLDEPYGLKKLAECRQLRVAGE
ncbi:MAG: hypothetical protein JW993_17575 [Sedimentisphaerales bacterium]|nr:hypothetical protein [Sedimentisphaerales bacterium]